MLRTDYNINETIRINVEVKKIGKCKGKESIDLLF